MLAGLRLGVVANEALHGLTVRHLFVKHVPSLVQNSHGSLFILPLSLKLRPTTSAHDVC